MQWMEARQNQGKKWSGQKLNRIIQLQDRDIGETKNIWNCFSLKYSYVGNTILRNIIFQELSKSGILFLGKSFQELSNSGMHQNQYK